MTDWSRVNRILEQASGKPTPTREDIDSLMARAKRETALYTMGKAELQAEARKRGIPAKQSISALIAAILRWESKRESYALLRNS
jgi:hypothetical protein